MTTFFVGAFRRRLWLLLLGLLSSTTTDIPDVALKCSYSSYLVTFIITVIIISSRVPCIK